MYDLHCHILYGIDDGANTLQESVEMAQIAYEGGTDVIVVTPHSNVPDMQPNFYDEDFKQRLVEIQTEVNKRNIPVKFLPGQEIFCQVGTINLLKSGKLITLNGTKYPLVEFDFDESSEIVLVKLKRLLSEGYIPIVAHPERYSFAAENFESLIKIKKSGCLIQMNKGSLKGKFGRTAQAIAEGMLDSQIVDIVASDAHGPFVRTPFLSDVHETISEMYSTDYAELLLSVNPKAVLENKMVLTY